MSKGTVVITDKFKNTFVRTNGGGTRAAEVAYYALGFRHADSRAIRDHKPAAYIRANGDGELAWASSEYGDTVPSNYDWIEPQPREVTLDELERAGEEVRQIKRAESKAQKKRAALRKWDKSATKKTHGVRPVRGDVLVAVKFKDGDVGTGRACEFYWQDTGSAFDIVSYKVLVPNKHKPQPGADKVVSQEEMFFDIATSMGKNVALKVGSLSAIGSGPGIIVSGNLNTDKGGDFVVDAEGKVLVKGDFVNEVVGDVNSDARGSGARFNAGKPDFSLIPMTLLEGEARVWAYGAKKYKAWNWMKGMDWNVPFACAMRHMAAWQRGEDTDPETGESHLDHAMCNLRMLRYYTDYYKEGDNRPKEFFKLGE